MLIFIDYRSADRAKKNLSSYGTVIEFETSGIVEEYISGHPDLFMCQTPDKLIVAPNLPQKYFSILDRHSIRYAIGSKIICSSYPNCAAYNSVVNDNYIISKKNISDELILQAGKSAININQGMTRCSLLSIDNNNYLTSDKGIEKTLLSNGLDVCYVDPAGILLPGKDYGLIGGTAGVYGRTVFFNGSLSKFTEGEKIDRFIKQCNFEIVELDNSTLFDGGGIFFVKTFKSD